MGANVHKLRIYMTALVLEARRCHRAMHNATSNLDSAELAAKGRQYLLAGLIGTSSQYKMVGLLGMRLLAAPACHAKGLVWKPSPRQACLMDVAHQMRHRSMPGWTYSSVAPAFGRTFNPSHGDDM